MNAGAGWLPGLRDDPVVRLRLFCFAHAGGGTGAFQSWSRLQPAWLQVCPVRIPGRESLYGATPYTRMDALVPALEATLGPHLNREYALFGHSLGAIVAFELARAIEQRGWRPPSTLVVSGRAAPRRSHPLPPTHHLAMDEFIRVVQERYNAIPQAILDDQQARDFFLPVLRADMELIETWRYRPGPPLSCPIVAFSGVDDRTVAPVSLEAWGLETRGPFECHLLPGGHFFLATNQAEFLPLLTERLARSVPDAAR